jgi:hypothetical protein
MALNQLMNQQWKRLGIYTLVWLATNTAWDATSANVSDLPTALQEADQVAFSEKKYEQQRKQLSRLHERELREEAEMRNEANLPAYQPSIGIGQLDLNEDGKKEVFAYRYFRSRCGSAGCPLSIYRQTNGHLDVTNELLVVDNTYDSVYILRQKTNGYRDIALGGKSSTGSGNDYGVWKWNGKQYQHHQGE